MRFWIVAASGIATVVVCCAVRAGFGVFSDEVGAEAARAAVMLLAGAWTGAMRDTRTIGMIFMFGGLLGVVGMLSQLPGLHIDSGSDVGLEDWLHHWIWVPQVMAPLLLVTALFPDGRPAWPWLIWLSVLTIGCLAVAVATFDWPRGDGGTGGNPVALPAPIEDAAGFGALFLIPASALLVLVSLLRRWSDSRRSALYPAGVLVVAVPFLLLDLATWFPAFHAAAIAVGGSPAGLSRLAGVRQDGPHADPPTG
ncbi:hypothetical protein ACFSKW_22395 [Nonomuraea mangrovi]|uniref:Uncharacterized protein n=1 Tax=Nonomuraea mangrovi TaxID=2316207 RepID=A0ABW4SX37_9ACTN